MSFTYTQLKTAIQDFTENSETSFVTNLPVFIRGAEDRIFTLVDLELFRKNATSQTTIGDPYISVPVDYRAPFSFQITSTNFKNFLLNKDVNFIQQYTNDAGPAVINWDAVTAAILEIAVGLTNNLSTVANAITNGFANGDFNQSGSITAADALDAAKFGTESLPAGTAKTRIESVFAPALLQAHVANPDTYSAYVNSADTAPKYYGIFDVNNFILGPTPNQVYDVELHYYYRPASITAGAESGTTWLSENAPNALLYGSLVEAYTYMKGEADMMQLYEQRFMQEIQRLKDLAEARENSDAYRRGLPDRPRT